MWHIALIISIMILLIAIIFIGMSACSKRKFTLSPINTLMIGVFFASTIIFIPIYAEVFSLDNVVTRWFKTIVISMHHAIRLFFVDSDFEIIINFVGSKNNLFYNIYSCYVAILFVLSPVFTFGVALSFFKNASAYRKYIKSYNKNLYVFSTLNEKAISLAESIFDHYKDSKIIFSNVQKQNQEGFDMTRVRKIKAICFKDDILSINFNFHNQEREIKFFMIDDNESENLKQALILIKKYQNRAKTWMYVFSNELDGEVLLSSIGTNALKVRRISDVRTFIYTLLENSGEFLFRDSIRVPEFDNKSLMSAVVVGLGKNGTEMTKSLVWFGQMGGFRIEITAFDKRTDAREKFCALCPELMDDKYNNKFFDDGEAQYKLDIREGVNVDTITFLNEVDKISHITYIFVDIGNDEDNIKTAIKLRSFLEKRNLKPRIQAVITNSDKKNALNGITNHSGQSYDIDFVGDVKSLYAVGSIIDSDLEADALSRHKKWGNEEDFWKYEYNHRSSIASALHRRMKIACSIPGINKNPIDRTDEERLNLRMMEHRRWNAYMRSEGYTYAKERNNLAKNHNCLVTYNELSPEEKAKDDD